jgi:hypothetical protein
MIKWSGRSVPGLYFNKRSWLIIIIFLLFVLPLAGVALAAPRMKAELRGSLFILMSFPLFFLVVAQFLDLLFRRSARYCLTDRRAFLRVKYFGKVIFRSLPLKDVSYLVLDEDYGGKGSIILVPDASLSCGKGFFKASGKREPLNLALVEDPHRVFALVRAAHRDAISGGLGA